MSSQTLLGLNTDNLQKQFSNLSNSVLAFLMTYLLSSVTPRGQLTEQTTQKFAKFAGATG